MFIVKYSASGNVLLTRKGTGTAVGIFGNEGYSIATDASAIYVTGGFSSPTIVFGTDTIYFPSGGYDPIFLVKYDTSLNVICTSALASGGDDQNAVATDGFGNAYIAGDFYNVNPFIVGTDTLSITGTENIFVAKYNCNTLHEGIREQTFQETISIYPNPFTSQTTINFSAEQKNTTIKITDLLGKEIKTINFTGRQLVIDKAEMKAGIYFVQTTDEKKNITNNKIIIQ